MTMGLATVGYATPTPPTPAGGASGVRFYFTMVDENTGALTSGLTISASELQLSINGAAFGDRVGATPTSIGSGCYYYVLDSAEAIAGATVLFKINKTGYKDSAGQPIIQKFVVDTLVGEAQSAILAALTSSVAAVLANQSANVTSINSNTDSEIAAAITAINSHTDTKVSESEGVITDAIDDIPTAAEIDAQLSAAHGAGTWGTAGLDVNAIVTAVFNALVEGSVTFGDSVRALLSLTGGPVGDFNTGTLVFKSLNGAKTRLTITTDDSGRLVTTIGDLSP